MRVKGIIIIYAVLALGFSLAESAFGQDDSLYIAAYNRINYGIFFNKINDGRMLITRQKSKPHIDKTRDSIAVITLLEIGQFRNAVGEVLQITDDTLSIVGAVLLNSIISRQFETKINGITREFGQRLDEASQASSPVIAQISFRNKDNSKIHLLIDQDTQKSAKSPPQIENSIETKYPAYNYLLGLPFFGIGFYPRKDKFYYLNESENCLTIKSIHVAFENGQINDLKIMGTLSKDTKEVYFENKYPISVYTRTAIERLNTRGFYILECIGSTERYYIDLADAINYDRNLAQISGNYSPDNQIIEISQGSKAPVKLTKKAFYKNFDLRIFTDITGIKEDNPNGLLQTEGQYFMPFNTMATELRILPISFTFFGGFSPYVSWSKIENKNKVLQPERLQDEKSGITYSKNIVPMDVIKYSYLNMGAKLNYLTLYWSTVAKLKIDIGAGFFRTQLDSSRFGVFAVSDSNGTRESYYINGSLSKTKHFEKMNLLTWYWTAAAKFIFVEGDNLDFDLSYEIMYMRSLNTRIAFSERLRPIHRFQMNLNIHPNPSKPEKSIFLRTSLYATSNDNHLEMQIGYAAPISSFFGDKSVEKK